MWFKKNKRIDISDIKVNITISDEVIKRTLKKLDITILDLKYLKSMKNIIEANSYVIIDNFYDNLVMDESLVKIINSHSSVNKLKLNLRTHILEMFNGVIDAEYIKRREIIANVHLRINLPSNSYIASFTSILKDTIKIVNEYIENDEDKMLMTQAIVKIVSLEKQLTLQAYDKLVEKQQREIQESKDKLNTVIIDSSSNLASVSEESSASYQQIITQVHNVLEFAFKAQQLASQMEDKANEGKSSIQRQSSGMHQLINDVEEIKKDMSGMMEMNKQIEDIVYKINSIADTTKLISLNAQIESSRVGVQGSAFGIIANEVRNLSLQTNDSIKVANNLLSTMRNETQKMHDNISNVSSSVEGSKINLLNTEDRFSEIMSYTHENNNQVSLIKNEINDLESVMSELNDALFSVADSADKLVNVSRDLLQ